MTNTKLFYSLQNDLIQKIDSDISESAGTLLYLKILMFSLYAAKKYNLKKIKLLVSLYFGMIL